MRAVALSLLYLLAFAFATAPGLAPAQSSIAAGHVKSLNFIPLTFRWVGLVGEKVSGDIPLSMYPYKAIETCLDCPTPYDPDVIYPSSGCCGGAILRIAIPDYNPDAELSLEEHWIFIMPINTSFNISRLESITYTDLQSEELFSSSLYRIFYPNPPGAEPDPRDYYQIPENPNATFCCEKVTRTFGVHTVEGYLVRVNSHNFTLLKYNEGGTYYPVYLVDPAEGTCFDGSSCVFELFVPSRTYSDPETKHYLYIIPHIIYEFHVWIDGVESTEFPKTALPYKVTVQVYDRVTGDPIPGVTVAIFEDNGNNIFVPLNLPGAVSRAIAAAVTNSSGMASFVIAPTKTGKLSDYSIKVAVLNDRFEPVKEENLTVLNYGEIPMEKKPLTPDTLADNAKVSVNAMASIVGALYDWANNKKQAKVITITVDPVSKTYTASSTTIKTGAPNVITVYFTSGSGYVKPKQEGGFLLLNPTYEYSNEKHYHNLFYVPTGQSFVITPTYYYPAESNVTLEIYDSNKNFLFEIPLTIDADINYDSGSYFENDAMKVQINDMASIVGSLYYALN